jgi:hypothetical protein
MPIQKICVNQLPFRNLPGLERLLGILMSFFRQDFIFLRTFEVVGNRLEKGLVDCFNV